jgi:enoyl-[acyl-carrier-protein] reductase (NADH)
VRGNAIAPGLLLPSFDQSQAEFERAAQKNPLGRPVDLDDLASAAEFLMSNTALTGQVIHVDNGRRLIAASRDVMFDR